MGRLGYDPGNIDPNKGPGKQSEPGRYPFVVIEVEEKSFGRDGNTGLKVVMEVAVGDRDIKVFENLIYVEQSQWRLKQFLESVGLDYDDPPDIDDLFNTQGVADFKLGKPRGDNDRRYLEVDHFQEQGTKATGPSGKGSSGAGSQPPLPSRRRQQESKSSGGSRGGGGGRSRSRRSKQDDEAPPRERGGKRGTMLGGGDAEPGDDDADRDADELGLSESDLPF